jgi:hypothetical protein
MGRKGHKMTPEKDNGAQPDANGWYPIESAPRELFGEPSRYGRGPRILSCAIGQSWHVIKIVSWHWHGNAKSGAWKDDSGRVWQPDYFKPLGPPPLGAE